MRDGIQATVLRARYRNADEDERAQIKRDLLAYNREDIDALVRVTEVFKRLRGTLPSSATQEASVIAVRGSEEPSQCPSD